MSNVTYEIWAECHQCGWRQYVEILPVNATQQWEPREHTRLTVDAIVDGVPTDLFGIHRCDTRGSSVHTEPEEAT